MSNQVNETVDVTIVRVPGGIKNMCVERGTTIEELFSIADEEIRDNEVIKINGISVDKSKVVENGDRVTINKMIKGNK